MKALRFFFLACALLAAFSAASLWRDRQNTLQLYPEWASVKTGLGLGVNGAHSFVLTPISLLGRALNLAAWHSQQEVALSRRWEACPSPIRYRVFARGPSEASLLLRSPEGDRALAFRLSSRPQRPSAWMPLDGERRALARAPVAAILPDGQWLRVELRREGETLVTALDGKSVSVQPFPRGACAVAFHGHSEAGTLKLDDVELGEGAAAYTQSFGGVFPWWLFVPMALLLPLLLLLLDTFGGAKPAFAVALGLGVLSALALALYDSTIGNQYPRYVGLPGKSPIDTREVIHIRLGDLPPGRPVLLWLGGSQAWGAGATREDTSAFGRLARELGQGKVELVNGAVSAATLEDQLETLRIVSARRQVHAVVLTTGVNDALNDSFPAKLKLLADAVKQRGAKLLLVVEPVDQPVGPNVKKRQEELRAFAAGVGLPLVDLQPALDRAADTGYLWWDFVHLSDSGAAVVARELTEPVKKLIATPR